MCLSGCRNCYGPLVAMCSLFLPLWNAVLLRLYSLSLIVCWVCESQLTCLLTPQVSRSRATQWATVPEDSHPYSDPIQNMRLECPAWCHNWIQSDWRQCVGRKKCILQVGKKQVAVPKRQIGRFFLNSCNNSYHAPLKNDFTILIKS